MSEFIGVEASVLIVPDTSKFRAELQAQIVKATQGLKVVIPAVAVANAQKAASATQANAVANAKVATTAKAATVATKEQAAAEAQNLAMQKAAAKAALEHALAEEQKKIQLAETAALQEAAATTARAEAVADKQAAAAAKQRAAAEAAKNAQLSRGAGATGLSLLGVRGATLASGAEFLAGAAAITILSKAVKGAIDDEESLFRVTRVLGTELGEKSRVWSQTLANSFGIADDSALKFEGAIAETLHNVGILPEQNAALSQTLVELAADMAAFAHVPVEDTLRGLQLAVSGNTRSLRQYGIVIQNTEVQQRALARSGKTEVDQLTRQELALARISIIQERASNQVGAFAANSDSAANRAKVLSANLDNLGDSVGHLVLGPLADLASIVSKDVKALSDLINKAKDVASLGGPFNVVTIAQKAFNKELVFAISPLAAYVRGAQALAGALSKDSATVQDVTSQHNKLLQVILASRVDITNLLAPINSVTSALAGMGSQAVNTANLLSTLGSIASGVFGALSARLSLVQEAVLQTQIRGGSLQDVLGAQQAAIAVSQGKVAAATIAAGTIVGKGHDTAVKQRQAAEEELKQAQDAAASTQAQIAAGAKKESAAAKKAGKTRQEILDSQDQALLTEQQIAQTDVQIASVHAQHTKSLVDDLAVLRSQLALTERQIVEAQKIHDATLRRQTIQQLTLSAEQTRLDIQQTKQQQLQNIRDRKVTAAEAAVESARLDAELADTLKKPKAQIAALQRENKALEEERKLWVGNTLKQKEIRNQIAANNATIKELRKVTDDRNSALRALEFQFLQTQAGFAANLLSNLLPTSSVAGTVGGGAINTATGDAVGPAGFATAAHQRPGKDLSAATQAKAAGRGASMSQMSVLISIQRAQLDVLARLVGQRTHPEATHQRVATGEAGHYF